MENSHRRADPPVTVYYASEDDDGLGEIAAVGSMIHQVLSDELREWAENPPSGGVLVAHDRALNRWYRYVSDDDEWIDLEKNVAMWTCVRCGRELLYDEHNPAGTSDEGDWCFECST